MLTVFELVHPAVSLHGIISQVNITLSVQADIAKVSAEQTVEFLQPELLHMEGIQRPCKVRRENPPIGS
jgi:hypothetical protein